MPLPLRVPDDLDYNYIIQNRSFNLLTAALYLTGQQVQHLTVAANKDRSVLGPFIGREFDFPGMLLDLVWMAEERLRSTNEALANLKTLRLDLRRQGSRAERRGHRAWSDYQQEVQTPPWLSPQA